MSRVAVLAPVLGRPERALPLAESLNASVAGHEVVLMPLVSLDDAESIVAWNELAVGLSNLTVRPTVVAWPAGPGDWARKINYGYRRAHDLGYEWMLFGADDLAFHPGWVDAALHTHAQTEACVIGTNDLGNPTVMAGHHSTHPLVHRDYLECGTVDASGLICHEAYSHQYVDTELIETAKWRGTFAFSPSCHVEHLHPLWGKGEDDATYVKGRVGTTADRALYQRRRRLWT